MRIRKFEAPDMREALALVKRELGPDAMVIATRQLRKGLIGGAVEVTAAVDEPEAPGASPGPGPSFYGRSGRAGATSPPNPNATSLSEADVERIMAPLRSELRTLRSMMRAMSEPSTGQDDVRAELAALRATIAALKPNLSIEVQPSSPRPLEAKATPPHAQPSLGEIAARANLASPSERRVVVVVGPTGVGKTTTIAKLAARSALVAHEKVALVTLDSYRVGGEEQMRTYADLIGVPLSLVPTPNQLTSTLGQLRRYDRVYVDTAGRSPRDTAALGELGEAILGIPDAEVQLALPAGLAPGAMDTVFRHFSCLGLDRLLFTKLDEADDLDELVRAPARLGRPVSHITTGQRVPEDFEDATSARLLELAMRGLHSEGIAA